jgi:hypothetical protein
VACWRPATGDPPTRTGRLRARAITGAAVLALLAATGTANTTTKIVRDAGWQSFITGGGIGGASTAGPWTFTTTAVAKLTVTDAFCHSEFFVGPGPHAIEFENKALWSETSTGTGAYFRVDSVAVAKSDCQQAGWMNYGNLFKNQGACLTVAS